MAKILKAGELIKGYRIKREVNQGNFCNSYFGVREDTGEDVFLKQYSEPTQRQSWYTGFIELQDEIKQRLEKISIPELVEQSIEYFEYDSQYFQAKDLFSGKSLAEIISINSKPDSDVDSEEREYRFEESQWFVNSALMMKAIEEIHNAGIVHTDLKPDNIYMCLVPAKVKFRAKVIDFDFSIIEDEAPPFMADDGPGIVGTPGYLSPEHMNGQIPNSKSDIFTCGIILYELLCGPSPFYKILEKEPEADNNALLKAVSSGSLPKPEEINADLNSYPNLCDTMFRMLADDWRNRPSAAEVHDVLIASVKVEMAPKWVNLVGPSGKYKSIHADTIVTHESARIFGDEYKYVDQKQFRIFQGTTDGFWYIEGLQPVVNNTRVNGEKITGKVVKLEDGDNISVAELKLAVKFIY